MQSCCESSGGSFNDTNTSDFIFIYLLFLNEKVHQFFLWIAGYFVENTRKLKKKSKTKIDHKKKCMTDNSWKK